MLIFNLHFIVFIIMALISSLSIAKDNLSKIPIAQNPITVAPTVKKPTRTPVIKNSTTTLMFRKNSDNWSNLEFVKVGTIATAAQICKVFSHPFFKGPKNYRLLDTTNGQFRWDGIEASTLWIKKKLKDANAKTSGLGLDENTLKIADKNFTACLKKIKIKNPKLFNFIKYRFLHYFKDNCREARFKLKKKVDDNGNITEERIPLKKSSCINFNYNSRDYSYWNSTTFVLMLVWKEAHPVLSTIFDKGNKVLNARLIKQNKLIEQKRLAEEKNKGERQKQKELDNTKKQLWIAYKSRNKTLMEQVYNFSTTGKLEGSLYNYWVEYKKCVLSNGRKTIDNRKINMTAFRIYLETKRNNKIKTISSDGKFYFSTNENISIDRLQNAWKLAFKKCPGKTSRF